LKGFLEPILDLKRQIGRIARDLDFYGNQMRGQTPLADEAREKFRRHACELREKLNTALFYRDAPSNSNRFPHYPGFGFNRRQGTRSASFCLTGETESGAHTHPASQSTFGSAVRACLAPGDRREFVEGSVKRGRHRPHSLGPDK
jgi:hypothetical protein